MAWRGMMARQIGVALATGLLGWGFVSGTAVRADHLTPKHDPWAQPWELERMALLDVLEDMVLVPGGPFLMGSDPKVDREAGPQEQPQRRVYLDTFEIGKYEVTALEYLKFVLATNRAPQLEWRYDDGNFQEAMARHPVMHVSWYDADSFCKWADKRLPTEAE